MTGDVGTQTRGYGRAAGLLTAALAAAGALTYLFFAVASHSLDPDDYGRIVVLWSVAFLLISTLFRPVEQLLAKTVVELEEQGQSISHAMRVAAAIQLGLALVFAVTAFIVREPIEDELFDGESLFFWVLLGTVLASSGSYFVRGFFAGSRRMGFYAALLVVEGCARFGLSLAVAVGISEGATLITAAIGLAPLAGLAVVPVALARSRRPGDLPGDGWSRPEQVATEGAPEFTLAQGGGFAAAVLLIMFSEQILLNSGVLFARVDEGAAGAGFIFNVLMVARAPVVLFAAVAATLLPHLTRLRSRGDEASGDAFAQSIRATITVIVTFAALAAIGLVAIGPDVMQIAFGDNFDYDRAGLVIVAVGMGFYLSAATLNQAALAQGQVRRAAACWVSCAAAFAAWNLLPVLDAFQRVELGFAGAAALLCGGLFLIYQSPHPVEGDEVGPGSAHELEARLAAADEIA